MELELSPIADDIYSVPVAPPDSLWIHNEEAGRRRAEKYGLVFVSAAERAEAAALAAAEAAALAAAASVTAAAPAASDITSASALDAPRRRRDRSPPMAGDGVTGFDTLAPEEKAKGVSRAARFGGPVFDFEKERAAAAGLGEDELRVRRERRERATRFGVDDALDIALANGALAALGAACMDTAAGPIPDDFIDAIGANNDQLVAQVVMDEVSATTFASLDTASAAAVARSIQTSVDPMGEEEKMSAALTASAAVALVPRSIPLGAAEPRPEAIHMRAHRYLPAATRDVFAFVAPLRPTRVEWLNGVSLNIVFADADTASRAVELLSEPVPTVKGVKRVHPAWRTCLRPIEKQGTDDYAPRGAETTVWLRPATTHDHKAFAPATHGEWEV